MDARKASLPNMHTRSYTESSEMTTVLLSLVTKTGHISPGVQEVIWLLFLAPPSPYKYQWHYLRDSQPNPGQVCFQESSFEDNFTITATVETQGQKQAEEKSTSYSVSLTITHPNFCFLCENRFEWHDCLCRSIRHHLYHNERFI